MWCCPVVEVGLKTKHKILIAPTKASVKCVTAYIRLWLVILWLWCVMLLFWLLLRSLVGYCCACGLLMWLCCCAIGDIHTGVKSGCKLVTLLSFLWYDKLWGPSQRVVTLLLLYYVSHFQISRWWWPMLSKPLWTRQWPSAILAKCLVLKLCGRCKAKTLVKRMLHICPNVMEEKVGEN